MFRPEARNETATMRIGFSAPAGPLATRLAGRLVEDGFTLQPLVSASGVPRRRSNGDRNGRAVPRGELRGARALLHLACPAPGLHELSPQLHSRLLPLAFLLDQAAAAQSRMERLVVVSPATVYGEGNYHCPVNGPVARQWRREADLRARRWEHHCPVCGEQLVPAPTPEAHAAAPLSSAGALAYAQERLLAAWGREHGIPVAVLRYFEVYGERGDDGETAVVRAVNGLTLEIPEDGGQTRDYIHIEDVVRAIPLVLRAPCKEILVVNVGTGVATSALEFAACLERVVGRRVRLRSTGTFQRCAPRHLYAATGELARLGYHPVLDLEHGLRKCLEAVLESARKFTRGRKS